MWESYETSNVTFNAGIDPSLAAVEERKKLALEAINLDIWHGTDFLPEEDPTNGEQLLDDLEQEDILDELLRNARDDLLNEEAQRMGQSRIADAQAWSPYESKTMFLLDTIDNLPRTRISNSLMNVFLWILRETGAHNVPSLYHLRQVQASLRKSSGVPTTQHKSPKGNVFSMNDPRTLVAMDWANPTVCEHICRYPVIPPGGVVSEVYHAHKWRKDVDPQTLSPMYDAGNCHYYINELARLKSGKFIIPVRWLEDTNGRVFADAYAVTVDHQSIANVNDEETILVEASTLQDNFLDLTDLQLLPTWNNQAIASGYSTQMPNPDRALAEGDPLYTSWIDIFGDDVSGNRSKSWNKHWNIYMSHRNLPRKLLQQEFHTHFVSTSPVASIPEQFHSIKQVIESTHKNPVKVRHGKSGTQIRFKLYVNCGPGDNPAQSEVCGHIGGNGNHLCRKCHAGGTREVKRSNDGFHGLFESGIARTATEILADIESQVKLACLGNAQNVSNQQTKNGIKDAYTQYWIDYLIDRARATQKAHPERTKDDIQNELLLWVQENKTDIYNPFLTLKGFDPAIDTPVEILHTILLGIIKYLWHGSHTPWTVKQKQTYSVRLQSTNTSALSIHAIRANYIMQYANSLIGRQFKTIAQVNVFHVYDLVDSTRFALTKAVGELSALLWIPEIMKMEEYLSDVEVAAANVLDLFAMIDPTKMTSKVKLHLLAHLKEDIIRFGPLVGVATETFECFNAIFRFCSIFSNHLAPSRDIAFQLASQEVIKHRLTGGWWPTENGEWNAPGPSVQNFIHDHPTLQALIGWTSNKLLINGSFKLKPLKRDASNKIMQNRQHMPWSATNGAKALNSDKAENSQWTSCQYFIAQSGDRCVLDSWIFAASPFNVSQPLKDESVTGRIIEILADSAEEHAVVILDLFVVLGSRHTMFGMPMLARRQNEKTYAVIPSTAILFSYNVQHDCPLAKCTASGEQPLMQERVESGLTKSCIEHQPMDRFVINTHAFHNAHLLRAALPRSLTHPISIYSPEDRKSKHIEISQSLQAIQEVKQAASKAKGKQKQSETVIPGSIKQTQSGSNKRTRLERDEADLDGTEMETGQ
ncbi:hypothetical protein HYPSUDRAFT_1078326 [Hypholoma sublateritium FD-334 SS-4]|uniref:Uncharacterized protein n=1 Tax=Hypholoma sublateritium (strain FD-334 SS-4) TaxID=945553 RepID=A0A0D2P5K3_HYPSF|nr:hypothetical protein HYPSUDRAFT_1078326 [Hypholoma sublateritium FD-334 SS-4]